MTSGVTHTTAGGKLTRAEYEASNSHSIENINSGDTGRYYLGLDQDFSIGYSDSGGDSIRLYDAGDNVTYDYLAHVTTSGNYSGEHRFQNSRAWDEGVSPIVDIVQHSTGECVLRYQHSSRPAPAYDWTEGVMASLAGGVVQHNWFLFYDQDGSAMCVRGLTAAEQSGGSNLAGRVLFFHNFDSSENERAGSLWVCDPGARVEVRGNHDELQFLAKGWTTQTSAILEVQKSDGTQMFTVTNSHLDAQGNNVADCGILYTDEIQGIDGAGTLYISGSSGDDTPTPIVLRTGTGAPTSVLTERVRVTGDGSVTRFQLTDCYLGLMVTDTDSSTKGDIWYDDSEDKIKFRTGSGVETVTSA